MGPVAESVWGAERLDAPYVLTGHGGLLFVSSLFAGAAIRFCKLETSCVPRRTVFFFTADRIRLLTSPGLCFVREPRSKNIGESKNLYWPP